MQTGCRISTLVKVGLAIRARTDPPRAPEMLRFPTDSKPLSSFVRLYVRSQRSPMPPFFEIGRESAFTQVPAKFKVLQPEAARRKL
jgi:hypothetical protein